MSAVFLDAVRGCFDIATSCIDEESTKSGIGPSNGEFASAMIALAPWLRSPEEDIRLTAESARDAMIAASAMYQPTLDGQAIFDAIDNHILGAEPRAREEGEGT